MIKGGGRARGTGKGEELIVTGTLSQTKVNKERDPK